MSHELRVAPIFFKALWCGDKTFEVRKNDRNFEERDEIVLLEWAPEPDDVIPEDGYTGREICGVITYLTDFEQKPGHVVFSFRETRRSD